MDLFSSLESRIHTSLIKPTKNLSKHEHLNLYFSLLELQQSFNTKNLVFSDSFKQEITSLFSKQYDVPFENREFAMFLQNRFHFLTSQVAWNWKKLTLEEWTQDSLRGSKLSALQALFDSFFTLGKMNELDTQSEYVSEILTSSSLTSFPWGEAAMILENWFLQPEDQRQTLYFFNWYESQNQLPKLSFQHMNQLLQAIRSHSGQPPVVFCCKSESACKQCPHNRYWLFKNN